ncbi:dentin sialophosphoprotein [Monomorium pharaonis]|uniref:dentin sialophosphoprotein n=1 Tax=Monomorium pharaonis TaxID=307658 RepID=UPI001746C182|nr:dentin sialophosphoprotein [Monomorium pharaonis]
MSRNNKNIRRSALSFDGADGTLDIDHILQTDPWKNVEMFETKETACIQNVLSDFNNIITQAKTLKATGNTTAKKSPRSTKKSQIDSPIKDLVTNSSGISTSEINNVTETKTTVNSEKKRATPKRPRQRRSKTVEETELPETSSSANNNVTETKTTVNSEMKRAPPKRPRQRRSKTVEEMELPETSSSANNNVTETKTTVNSEMKRAPPKRPRQRRSKTVEEAELPETSSNTNNNAIETKITVHKKKRASTKPQQTSKTVEEMTTQELSCDFDDVKEKIQNLSNASAKNNVDLIEKTIKQNILQNIINITEENLQTSTPKRKVPKIRKERVKKELMAKNKKSKAETSENKSKRDKVNNKKEQCTNLTPNQIKKDKLKKENSENKLQKPAQSRKSLSPQMNNTNDTKCQCKQNCAKSDNQCSSRAKEDVENTRQYKKNIKAAKAIEGLSRRITDVKRKMDCIKNDLESNESYELDSSFTDSSSTSYSSSSYFSDSDSSCSCSNNCNCSYCGSYYTDTSDSSNSDENSESQTETGSEREESR